MDRKKELKELASKNNRRNESKCSRQIGKMGEEIKN